MVNKTNIKISSFTMLTYKNQLFDDVNLNYSTIKNILKIAGVDISMPEMSLT